MNPAQLDLAGHTHDTHAPENAPPVQQLALFAGLGGGSAALPDGSTVTVRIGGKRLQQHTLDLAGKYSRRTP